MSRSQIISDFNEYLEKATDPNMLEVDEKAIVNLCTMIDQIKITPEDAVQAITCKIMDKNPHCVLYALQVLDVAFCSCGSIIHKIICTADYMQILKDLVQATEHKRIKDQVILLLEKWANFFKHLPQYSEPQKLLDSLNSDANGLTSQDDNGNFRLKEFKKNYKLQSTAGTADTNNCNSKETQNNASAKEYIGTGHEYLLEEYRMKKKIDYKQFLKSQGLPTSSDEEENTKAEKSFDNDYGLLKSNKLPKDLENSKKQRRHLKKEAQEVRQERHKNFLENYDGNCTELKQCHNTKCDLCKPKKTEEPAVIPKQWPYEVRKIKQSKKQIANGIEEYKKSKKQSYYAQKSDARVEISTENTDITDAEKRSLTNAEREEEEMLRHAILLSQMENEPIIDQDTFLENDDDDDMLQRTMDMSFAEAENNYIPPGSNSSEDEDLQLSIVKKLSLSELKKEKTVSSGLSSDRSSDKNIGLCCVCYKKNFLKRFEPCNHTCICDECSEEYNSQHCPICKEYYTTISWNL